MFTHLNLCDDIPSVGDVLVIETKRSKGIKRLVCVKDVIVTPDCTEIILQKGRNKYFNFTMYKSGDSWVWRVWNLGRVTLTSGLNNVNMIDDM